MSASTYEFPEMQPQQRLQELILYIADRLQGDPAFGKVKLAKILYFIDFTSYRLYKKPVTGAAYIRLPHGPVPQPYFDILDEMQANGYIAIREEAVFDYNQQRIMAIRRADVKLFSGRDIQLVEDVIRHLRGKTPSNSVNYRMELPGDSPILTKKSPMRPACYLMSR